MQQKYYPTLREISKAKLTLGEIISPTPLLENRELTDVFMKLRLDHPQLFYAGTFKYRYYPDGSNAEFIPEYLFEKGKIKDHQKALQARVEKLARPAAKMTEWAKLEYIHDFICENVHYDKLKKIDEKVKKGD